MKQIFDVGDIIKLKKPHPCGSYEWEIIRIGQDFKLRCILCGHMVMTPRTMVEKNCRAIQHKSCADDKKI